MDDIKARLQINFDNRYPDVANNLMASGDYDDFMATFQENVEATMAEMMLSGKMTELNAYIVAVDAWLERAIEYADDDLLVGGDDLLGG